MSIEQWLVQKGTTMEKQIKICDEFEELQKHYEEEQKFEEASDNTTLFLKWLGHTQYNICWKDNDGLKGGIFSLEDACKKIEELRTVPYITAIYVNINPGKSNVDSIRYSNVDIINYSHLFVDLDPKGNYINDEKERSINIIKEELYKLGFKPLIADSGNGAMFLSKINMPNTKETKDKINILYEYLNKKLIDNFKVDISVKDACRICGVIGTFNRKINSPMRCILGTFPDPKIVVEEKQFNEIIKNITPKEYTFYAKNTNNDLNYERRLFWALYFKRYTNDISGTKQALQEAGFTILDEDGSGIFIESPNRSSYTTPVGSKDFRVHPGLSYSSFHQSDANLWSDALDFAQKYLPNLWTEYQTELAKPKKKTDRIQHIDGYNSNWLNAEGIDIEAIEWLWNKRIPLSSIVLLFGEAEKGKSQLSLSLASIVSNGDNFPNGEKSIEAATLILSAEDDMKGVLLPRLKANNANMKNIFILPKISMVDAQGIDIKKEFVLDETEVAALRQEIISIKKTGADLKLIIIDPIAAFFTDKTDTNNDPSVRSKLKLLRSIAEEFKLSFLLIAHMNKQTNTKTIHRISGSAGFINAVRSAFCVVPSVSGGEGFELIHAKSNNAQKQASFHYTIEQVDLQTKDGKKVEISKIKWEEETTTTLEDVDKLNSKDKDDGKLNKCIEWLEKELEKGKPILSIKIESEAKNKGWSYHTLRRAKEELKKNNISYSKKVGNDWFLIPNSNLTQNVSEYKIAKEIKDEELTF